MKSIILFAVSAILGTVAASAQPAGTALEQLLSDSNTTALTAVVPEPVIAGGAVVSGDVNGRTENISLADRARALNGKIDDMLTCLKNYIFAPVGPDGEWAVKFNQAYDDFFNSTEKMRKEAVAYGTPNSKEFERQTIVVRATANGAIRTTDEYAVAYITGAADAACKKIQMDANVAMAHQMIDGLVRLAEHISE
ncbi:MAG: hypothetical protein ABIG11_08765 [bacterium]